jgi:hypothetical protein
VPEGALDGDDVASGGDEAACIEVAGVVQAQAMGRLQR